MCVCVCVCACVFVRLCVCVCVYTHTHTRTNTHTHHIIHSVGAQLGEVSSITRLECMLLDACRTIHGVGAQLGEVISPAQERVHAGKENPIDCGEPCRRAHQHRPDDEAYVTL